LGGKNPLFAPCIPENNLVVIVGGFHFWIHFSPVHFSLGMPRLKHFCVKNIFYVYVYVCKFC
jgi:hypothetical protein